MTKYNNTSNGSAEDMSGYNFTTPGTLLFLEGAPLTGKTSVASLVGAQLTGCVIQSVDIIRLMAQDLDSRLPPKEQNPVLNYGSCDSYLAVGNGTYSPESFLVGYRHNAQAICAPLHYIIPRLEVQSAQNVLFEGVQLLPECIGRYVTKQNQNRIIVLTANPDKLVTNKQNRYGTAPAPELSNRYSIERLLLIQEEILRQADGLDQQKVIYVENVGRCIDVAEYIVAMLYKVNLLAKNET